MKIDDSDWPFFALIVVHIVLALLAVLSLFWLMDQCQTAKCKSDTAAAFVVGATVGAIVSQPRK